MQASIMHTWDPDLHFSAVTMSVNVMAKPHKDSYNHPCSRNLLLPAFNFQAGQIFLEAEEGMHRLAPGGVTGHLLSASEPISFAPRKLHATLPWVGTRTMIISYHTCMSQNLRPEDCIALQRMGFRLGQWAC